MYLSRLQGSIIIFRIFVFINYLPLLRLLNTSLVDVLRRIGGSLQDRVHNFVERILVCRKKFLEDIL